MTKNKVLINGEELGKLVNENLALKKQVQELTYKQTAKLVANHISTWLDKPYNGKTEREDIEDFALSLTRYIDFKLNNRTD